MPIEDLPAARDALSDTAEPTGSTVGREAGEVGPARLLELLDRLKSVGYRFVTPTPASHARVIARGGGRTGRSIRDLLGWSLPTVADRIDPAILDILNAENLLEHRGPLIRSRLRVSSLADDLYCHSAHPTTAADAVFFGPDSYRFAALIRDELHSNVPLPDARIVDMGTGTGVGAVAAGRCCPGARITMTDINAKALHYAAINLTAAGVQAVALLASDLMGIDGPVDLLLANPPYIADPEGREYRDGGGMHGGGVAVDMVRAGLPRIAPTGRMILYTGSAIIDGADPLAQALATLAGKNGCAMRYRELDPDVFGEELAQPAYADVDRIAVVAAIFEPERDLP